MSVWNTGIFDNDDAEDWLSELSGAEAGFLETTLSLAFAPYLEAPEGSRVICAAKAASMLLGNTADDAPEALMVWLSEPKFFYLEDLRRLALQGLDRVLADGSELNELWQESEEGYLQWKAQILLLGDELQDAAS